MRKGSKMTLAQRKRVSVGTLASYELNPSLRTMQSKRVRKYYKDHPERAEEHSRKHGARMRRYYASRGNRRKASLRLKEMWSRQEFREKMAESASRRGRQGWNEKRRKKQSADRKIWFSNPDNARRMGRSLKKSPNKPERLMTLALRSLGIRFLFQ